MSVKNKNYQKLPNTKPDVYLKYEKGPYKKKNLKQKFQVY